MTARRILRWVCLGCVLWVSPMPAQDGPTTPPPKRADDATTPAQSPSPPPPGTSAPSREFRPSEEVSPDQEVDFPADL